MFCLTCGYSLKSGHEEIRDKGQHEGLYHDPERRTGRLEKVQGIGRIGEQKARSFSNRGYARTNRAKKALACAVFVVPLFAADPSTKARIVTYIETEEIPHIYTGKGYETVVKLDKAEQVLLATTGIADFNPQFVGYTVILKFMGTQTGQKTDLRVVCASGNEYSFLVEEASAKKDVHPDLTVFVKNGDAEAQKAMIAPPRLFTADQVDALKRDAETARAALQKEQDQHKAEISKAAMKEVSETRHDYEFFNRKGEDFKPAAWHDSKFSFIEVRSQEVPAFFEIKEGQPSLVHATFADGHYVIPKVLDAGELRIGKSSIKFRRIG